MTMSIEGDIKTLDNMLSILRDGWMEATTKRRDSWMKKINGLLDQRLILMQQRDNKTTP